MPEILVANETFVAEHDGAPVVIHKDHTRIRAGHPIAEAHPDMFKPISVHYDIESADVESATAAPGEKRTVSRPRKPAAGKGDA